MDSRHNSIFDEAEIEITKAYFIFVLGYDILNEWLNSFDDMPCDVAFSICEIVYLNFRCSKYYNDMSMSEYEALQKYVDETPMGEVIKGVYLGGRKAF